MKYRLLIPLITGSFVVLLNGCYVGPHRGYVGVSGPVVSVNAGMVFDADLGVFVFRDHPNHYFYEGRYWRHDRGQWYFSAQMRGPWSVRNTSRHPLPPGLARHYGEHYEESQYQHDRERFRDHDHDREHER